MDFTYIKPEDAVLKVKEGGMLLHTLPADHFAKTRLPGAINACVYQVTFLDEVRALCANKDSVLVLYSSSSDSQDAVAAADKLHRDGYKQVYILEGGIVAWLAAGFPVEGDTTPGDVTQETLLPSFAGDYRLDTSASVVEWSGRNAKSKHYGTLLLQSGHLLVQGQSLGGELVVDMETIKNINLIGHELQPVLIAHLKSDDFFFTSLFPTATLVIDRGELTDAPSVTCINSSIKGTLKLRGVTKDLGFSAIISQRDNGDLGLEAHFDLDRTRWNVIYGSTRFFEHLGMHKVFDQISIELRLVFKGGGDKV